MNSFQEKESPTKETKAEEPVEQREYPKSVIFNNPKLWEEALEFANMLTYCRPHGTKAERQFIAKYLVPLGIQFDKKGNAYKKIGENPTVLWSSHIDTVHNNGGYQRILYWPHKTTGEIHFSVDQKSGKKSSCLGADDTCGIWLMIQMIKAKIPGLYIFHRAEEIGGIGSKWIKENNKDALNGIKFAIAFDRRDEKSIITYQRSRRCCSDEFAESLAAQLGMGHNKDTGGSFTDTASYVDLIAECTNVSVGYDMAHCPGENTNVDYLFRLRDALLKLDVTKLVESRKPGENGWLYQSYSYSGGSNSHSDYWDYERDWTSGKYVNGVWTYTSKKDQSKEGGLSGSALRAKYKGKRGCAWLDDYEFDKDAGLWFPKNKTKKDDDGKSYGSEKKPTYNDMVRMIRLNPEIIADILEQMGYDPVSLRSELFDVAALHQTVHF